jgi:hypothetical protein
LPHPSWHTIRWLHDNFWFENEALPDLRTRIGRVLDPQALDRGPRRAPAKNQNHRR